MFKRLRIRTKILIAFIAVAVLAVGIIGFFAFTIGSNTLEEASFSELTAVREMKADQIEDYFQLIEDQVISLSKDRMIIDAMKGFDAGEYVLADELEIDDEQLAAMEGELTRYYEEKYFPQLAQIVVGELAVEDYLPADERARIMQYLYIANNPFDIGSKQLLDDPLDGSSYSQSHALYHPIIRDYLERFGYYDIFLVDVEADGNIVYSVFKEVDYGTSLLKGPYANTNLAEAYRAAREANEQDFVAVADYDPYHPSYDAPAAFIASPIFDGEETIGVLIFQMPIERIDAIMTSDQKWSDVGLGESGETYLVGDDFALRNQSRFLIEDSENYFKLIEELGVLGSTIDTIRNLNTTIGLQEVDTEGTRAALAGETGTAIFPDYRGVPVLSSYKPLEIEGLNWAIMSEIDEDEAFASIQALGLRIGLGSVGLIVAIIVGATLFSRTITKPLEELQSQAGEISAGNLETRIAVDTEDEINDLAVALETMRLSNRDLIGDLEEINANLEDLVADRTAELEASERQSKSIIEQSNDAIIVVDQDGAVLVWNQAAERMFGYSLAEMVDQPINRIVPEVYEGRHQEAMEQAGKSGRLKTPGATHELSGKRRDGSEFPMEIAISQWELGGRSYFSASIRDITERKQAEVAIREREERIRSIVEIAPDAIISIDGAHNVIMFNSQAEKIFGYSADEVQGQPLTMLLPEASRNIHYQEVDSFQSETVSTRSMDSRRAIFGRRKDGEVFPAEAGISKLELDDGVIFTAFFRDITERVKMEQAIRESESRFRSLFEDSPISLWEEDYSGAKQTIDALTASGVDDLRQHFDQNPQLVTELASLVAIMQVNQATLDLYGATSEEELYGNLGQVFTDRSNRYFGEQLIALASGDTSYESETVNRRVNGEEFDCIVHVSIAPGYEDSWEKVFVSVTDISQMKQLERELALANERMSTELNFARDIQISMLPLIFPAFPDRREVSVHATLESAREVGGDFYDFYFLDDDHLAFIVGDVSGKGAPGALMMAVSKTLIKSRSADDSETASILTHVNDELSQDNVSSMFVTAFLGILNVKTGELVYTNAGHNPPYIRRKDGSIQKIDAFHGPVIGAMPGMPYGQDRDKLNEGDVILVYSDGVTEAFNEKEELFSEERLEALLQSESLDSDASIIAGVREVLGEFVGRAEQSDDITMLAVQFLLGPEAMETQVLQIIIKNRYEDMAIVDEQFSEFAEENNLPDAVRQSMSIVLDELLNNVISYAYHGEKEKEIEVGFELSSNRLVLTIKDSGVPFNPFTLESPDISESIEEREIGGLGIHMVRNMMDEYSYQRQINKNVVTLVKLLENENVG